MKLRLLAILFLSSQVLHGQDFSRTVVTVAATTQGVDYYSPWNRGKVNNVALSGCVIAGERILTLAHPLANHVLVAVCKHGDQRKYAASVLVQDFNCGLALLKVEDKSFFTGLTPAEFASSGTPAGRALIGKWDTYGTFKTYSAELFKTSIGFYNSGAAVLLHHMATGLDSGGNGEPVFVNGRLVGITSHFDSAQKTIKVHAVDMLRRMLTDLEDGGYDGAPFFLLNHVFLMSDENLRDYLGLGPADTGVLVNGVCPKASGHDVLRKGDVILSIDGVKIDDRGLYESGVYGKLNYCGIICLNHFVGDTARLQIVRNRQKMDVALKLLRRTDGCFLIPPLDNDAAPPYCIVGGLVFQELTEGYMTLWGGEWRKKADKRMIFLYDSVRLFPSPERRRIVILNRVLPASVNVGYHEKKNQVLLAVNGSPPKDLRHFWDLVAAAKGPFLKLDFQGGESIVVDREAVEKTAETILRKYNISAGSYFERADAEGANRDTPRRP